jgi:N-acetylneuraminic acid mutarotase
VSAEGRIFVIGGTDAAFNSLGAVEAYDPIGNIWSTGYASMPTPRGQFAVAFLGGSIYVCGGIRETPMGSSRLATVEAYDVAGDSWSTKAPLSGVLSCCAGACADGRIFVIGGSRTAGAVTTALVEAFDPQANSWETRTPMPTARTLLTSATFMGRIYAIGGSNGNSLATVEIYSPLQDLWTISAPLPTARSGLAASTVFGRIYAVGGSAISGNLATVEEGRSFVLAFVPNLEPLPAATSGGVLAAIRGTAFRAGGRTDFAAAVATTETMPVVEDVTDDTPFDLRREWTPAASMGSARRFAAGAVYADQMVVVGGLDASGNYLAGIERLAPFGATQPAAWQTLTPAMAAGRAGAGAAVIGIDLYVFGGETGTGTKTGALEVLDLMTDTWRPGPFAALGVARSHFGYAAFEGRLYAFGGEDGTGAPLASAERYNPSTNLWTPIAALPMALKGCLCLPESGHLKLFGGESAGGTMSDRVLIWGHLDGTWAVDETRLPYAARDLMGCTAQSTWQHRGSAQRDEFCLLGGGFDGTDYRPGFFRFYTQ